MASKEERDLTTKFGVASPEELTALQAADGIEIEDFRRKGLGAFYDEVINKCKERNHRLGGGAEPLPTRSALANEIARAASGSVPISVTGPTIALNSLLNVTPQLAGLELRP